MLIVIFALGAIALGVGVIVYQIYRSRRHYGCRKPQIPEEVHAAFIIGGGALMIVSAVTALCIGIKLSNSMIIDDKITMYKAQNEEIEQRVSALVDNYMEYEQDTYNNINCDDPMSLVILLPELKSSELVNSQIELYVFNNNKIIELEAEKLECKPFRWWLYFGN